MLINTKYKGSSCPSGFWSQGGLPGEVSWPLLDCAFQIQLLITLLELEREHEHKFILHCLL